jgi:cell division protein FtsB
MKYNNDIQKKFLGQKHQKFQLFLIGIIGLLVVLQVGLSNNLSNAGEKVTQLQADSQNLQKENELLKNEISKKQSLAYIEKKALDEGFTKIDNKLSIAAPIPVALKQ